MKSQHSLDFFAAATTITLGLFIYLFIYSFSFRIKELIDTSSLTSCVKQQLDRYLEGTKNLGCRGFIFLFSSMAFIDLALVTDVYMQFLPEFYVDRYHWLTDGIFFKHIGLMRSKVKKYELSVLFKHLSTHNLQWGSYCFESLEHIFFIDKPIYKHELKSKILLVK